MKFSFGRFSAQTMPPLHSLDKPLIKLHHNLMARRWRGPTCQPLGFRARHLFRQSGSSRGKLFHVSFCSIEYAQPAAPRSCCCWKRFLPAQIVSRTRQTVFIPPEPESECDRERLQEDAIFFYFIFYFFPD